MSTGNSPQAHDVADAVAGPGPAAVVPTNETKDEVDKALAQGCSFCGTQAEASQKLMLCAGCHMRPYCSKVCQAADWKSTGAGQGHSKWCRLGAGEEGVDWEVRFISAETGRGLFALRDFAANERILVERGIGREQCEASPRVALVRALMPENGSITDKYNLNALGLEADVETLCPLLAMTNHACDCNSHHYHSLQGCVILFSCKPIKAGEEVTKSYVPNPEVAEEAHVLVDTLWDKWQVRCPSSCACKSAEWRQPKLTARALDQHLTTLGNSPLEAMQVADALLALHARVNAEELTVLRTLDDAFQLGVSSKATLPFAVRCSNQALSIASRLFGAKSQEAQRYQGFVQHPSMHPNYLVNDAASLIKH